MEDRFYFLLEKYLDRTITASEEVEFEELLLSGRYEDQFRKNLQDFVQRDVSADQVSGQVDGNELYERILNEKHARAQDAPVKGTTDGKPFSLISSWWYAAAAIVCAVGIGWLLFLQRENGLTTPGSSETPSRESVISHTRKDFIRLPDGSTVLLNDGSELTYHLPFTDNREVLLKGEAFFDIRTDPARPFVVRTGKISTNVLGTAFNVNATDRNVVVTVTRGLVSVADESGTLDVIKPREQLTVNSLTSEFMKREVNPVEEIKWKDENLVFDDISLKEIAAILEKHYKVRILIENPDIENCRYDAWFPPGQSLEEILRMVCGIRQANYSISGSEVKISGGIPCRKK